jgi:urea carboxylase system permease
VIDNAGSETKSSVGAGASGAAGEGHERDVAELHSFGYRQNLDRSLGSFSSFAAGFSYISVLTGLFELFAFGFANAGPTSWWTWVVVFGGQFLVALCFAELAGQYPLAGSVYQWSKRVSGGLTSWMSGWLLIIGSIVTVAGVAVAWQVILPQVSLHLEFIGGAADAGTYSTKAGAENAIVLGSILVAFTTLVNMAGVRVMSRINNLGVLAELIGSTVLVVLLLFHAHRAPTVVLHSQGTASGHSWGLLGAMLIAGLMSAWTLYGFDTAGTLAEETKDPRRNAPPAILRALATAFIAGALLIAVSLMAVRNIHDKNIGVLGLPYIVKQALGNSAGNVFLIDVAIAITVCGLAVQTACIRMLFAMARDGRLPFGAHVARVSGRAKVPIVPAVLVGVAAEALLAVNIANQSAFTTLTSVAIVIFYLAYLGVTFPLLRWRLSGRWPRDDHGPYFRMGRVGILVNILAVVYGAAIAFNIAWPRTAVYGDAHWYFHYGAYLFIGLVILIGLGCYYGIVCRRPEATLAEHAAPTDAAGVEESELPSAGLLAPRP